MGEVYLAHDSVLDRRVALKFLQPATTRDSEARRLLVSEAQAAARLDHPYVCKIYEVAESHDPPFMAMEFVDGATLYARLRSGALSLKDTVRLASEIAEAVGFAHARGIVHRDLTPANIMLAGDGHIRVMDFGLARSLTPAAGVTTASAQIAGTTAYMSPEQLRGETVDHRSDIFAFGILLYEMAAGTHPFMRPSTFSTASAILNESPIPVEQKRGDVPPLLAHIIDRCLEKDRERRYQSMRDVGIELGTVAEPTSRGQVVPIARHRRRGGLVAAAAMALFVAGGLAVWQWPQRFGLTQPALAFNERDWIVISDVEDLTGEQLFDRSLRVAMEVGIAQSQYVNVLPPQRLASALQRMQRAGTDRLDEALASEIALREGAKAVLAGSITLIGGAYTLTARVIDPHARTTMLTESVRARDKDAILESLDDLLATVRRRLGESLPSTQARLPLPQATTSSLDALKLYADSLRIGATMAAGQAAFQLLHQAVTLDPDFALAHAELGRRYYLDDNRAERQRGEEHFTKAIGLLNRLTTRERLWITATADDSRGNRQRAVVGYRAYLAQYPDDSRAWFRVGWTHMAALGQYDEAIDAFQRAIQLSPTDAGSHVNLASSYSGLRRYKEAVDAYHQAFALDPSLRNGVFVNHEYGFTLVHLGALDEASKTFALMKGSTNSSDQSRGLRSQALLDMYRGRYGDAIAGLRQAVVINRAIGAGISEFRDRLFLVRALDAKAMSAAAAVELDAVQGLMDRLSLTPDWLRIPAKILARRGRVADARRVLAAMEKTAGSAVADSTTNRNIDLDRAYVDLARGEIALAERRPAEAAALFEAAAVVRDDADLQESLAVALAADGRVEASANVYEQIIARRPLGLEAQEHWLRAHVTLGELYDRLGRHDAAQRLYAQLLELWSGGDADLVVLRRARSLSRLR
jgi:tetratricopeptide (TPR) repeat protein